MKKELTEEQKNKAKLYAKEYRKNNKEKVNKYNREYIKNKSKEYKDKENKRLKLYNDNNTNNRKNTQRKYYLANKEKLNLKSNQYRINNKDKVNKKANETAKNRKSIDPVYKLKCGLRRNISMLINRNSNSKKPKTVDVLGCTYEEFKQHLESKFESWMTWENYGLYNGEFNFGWDIDHIKPLSSGNTIEEIVELNNYLNLQPLCSKINRDLKRNNY